VTFTPLPVIRPARPGDGWVPSSTRCLLKPGVPELAMLWLVVSSAVWNARRPDIAT
jgi:hypothetical protein